MRATQKAPVWALPAAIACADFLVRLLVAIRPIEYIDGWTIPDDAYISLTIARSIAHGMGPFFGLAHTNGFQPLYVFLMAPVFRIFPGNPETPIHIALILLALFDAVALYLVCRILMRTIRSRSPLLILGAVWVFNPNSVKHIVNGLETGISLCFAAAVVLEFARLESAESHSQERRRALVLGILGGFAVLARIDNLLLLAAAVFFHSWRKLRTDGAPREGDHSQDAAGKGLRELAANLAIAAAGAVIVNLPWLIYSLHYTGEIFPISGRAVRYHSLSYVDHAPTLMNYYYPNLRRSAKILLNGNRAAIAGGFVFAVLLAASMGRSGARQAWEAIRRHRLPWAHAFLLVLAYALYIFTPWYFPRYYLPAIIPFALTLGSLADLFMSRIENARSRRAFVAVALALLVGVNVGQAEFRSFYTNRDSLTAGYMNLGLWARSTLPDRTRIGSMQTGALAYFAPNLTVVNLDGVVNRACYEALRKKQGMEYIRGERIEYFVAWLENFETLMKETRSFRDDDLILVSRLDGFGSWRHNWFLYKVNYRGKGN
jgi:hypothetical protein